MSVTAPAGFRAAGMACGIKESGAPDLALVATADGRPAAAAAVFTSNRAAAAPVQVSRAHLRATGGRAAAVVLNSGNANAATGQRGTAGALQMCGLAALAVGCRPEEVLVCSTGLIGIPLVMGPLETGIPLVAAQLHGDGGEAAAEAIRTTDTVRKQVVVAGDGFTVGGMAKGAAMLAPDMATMLALLTTDADVDPAVLTRLLRAAVSDTFNVLSVDGCTSTNDTVIAMAGGSAGRVDEVELGRALREACDRLATQMAGDAEGATKVVRVQVTGAATDEEAGRAARKVAESQLCKCSWYGQDPYWGRIVSEVGSSGVAFDLERVRICYGGHAVAVDGVACEHDHAAVAAHMAQREIRVEADLGLGDGRATVLTNDLTHAYIDENMGTS